MKPVQIRMARAALGWGAGELGEAIGLSEADVERIEAGTGTDPAALARLRSAFEAKGILFLDADETCGPGVRVVEGRLVCDEGMRPEELNASNDG